MRPLLLLFLFAPQAQAEDAKAFAQRVLDADAMGWTKAHVTLRLTITDKKKRQKKRALEIKGATLKQRAHTLVRFAEPAELAGTAMHAMKNRAARPLSFCTNRPLKSAPSAHRRRTSALWGPTSYSDFEKRDTDEGIYRFGADKACGKRPAVSSTSRQRRAS